MSARRGKRGGGRGGGRGAGKGKGRWETTGDPAKKVIYRCKYCGLEFKLPQDLRAHKRAQHADEMSESTVRSGGTLPIQQPAGRDRRGRELMPPPSSRSPRTPQSQREEEEEEESPASEVTESEQEEETPRRRTPSPKKGPTAKRGGRGAKNMPLPIGTKRKTTDPVSGREVEEWIRNPKFAGA